MPWFRDGRGRSAGQNLSRLLWNMEFHCRIQITEPHLKQHKDKTTPLIVQTYVYSFHFNIILSPILKSFTCNLSFKFPTATCSPYVVHLIPHDIREDGIYETRSFVTAFTTAFHPSLSRARSIQSMPPFHFSKIHFNIILPPTTEDIWLKYLINVTEYRIVNTVK